MDERFISKYEIKSLQIKNLMNPVFFPQKKSGVLIEAFIMIGLSHKTCSTVPLYDIMMSGFRFCGCWPDRSEGIETVFQMRRTGTSGFLIAAIGKEKEKKRKDRRQRSYEEIDTGASGIYVYGTL